MNTFKTFGLITILAIALSACGNKQVQVKKYYRLASYTETTITEKADMLVVVKKPAALSILGGRPMVATQDDQSLVQLSSHFWIESPKVLLEDILKQWAGNHWNEVSSQTPYQQPHHILSTRILAFEKKQQETHVTLEFNLIDQDNNQLLNKTLSQNLSIKDEGYQGFVQAISASIDSILAQLSDHIAHVLQ